MTIRPRPIAALLAGLALLALAVSPAEAGERPAPASWAFAIGDGQLRGGPRDVAARLGRFDLVVVDGEEARRAEVAALHGRGTVALAYLSVGTIERWRRWYRRLERFRLTAWRDWPGEWFADVSRAGYRRAIAHRVAPRLLAKGFDGLFLDNVDMVELRRHRWLRPGMRRLVAELDRVLGRERLLFTQNGFPILRRLRLLRRLDGWNREDVTWTYDFGRRRYERNGPRRTRRALAELERAAGRGIVTTATDYTARPGGPPETESVANACGVGALPYVSDIGLTARRLPAEPLSCP